EDNGEKDYKEVPFKNKAVVVTAKEDILRIVDELIWDIENQIETYVVNGSGWVYEISEEVNIEMPIYIPLTASSHFPLPKGLLKRNNEIINIKNEDDRCFEWTILAELFPSEKELIPIRIAPKSKVYDRCNHKVGNCQPQEPAQHYCLIQGRNGLGKLAGYTTKYCQKLYVCYYCVSHQTHDPKIDAQHMEDCEGINTPVQRTVMPSLEKNIYKFRRYEQMLDAPFTCTADAETLSTLIKKNQGSKTIAIQEHKVISFDYIIRRSDGKSKVPVKIRGDDPAGEFIKAMEKEAEKCQDFLAEGHIIRNSAKKLTKMLQSGIIPEEIAEDYIINMNIFQSWELGKINLNLSKEYKKLICLKHYLKGLYLAHKKDALGVDIGIMYRLANTIYCKFDAHLISQAMGQVSKEKISAIPHNMEKYLRAEPCEEEVDKDGKSLNLPCKKPGHLYRIDSNRCFAHPEKFPATREYGPKGRDDLVFYTEEAIKKLYTWLLYVDANALYTGAMMQAMPTGEHRWITPKETPDLFNKISKCEISNDADKGYILEVDFDYPYKLHKAHTSYPLAPENIEISKEEMNFVRPEGESKKFKKLVANPSYKSHRILAENLVGISRHQSKARLSKPIFIGMSVLDESKITMYNFYYNIMKARYGNKIEMVYTDTDSLILLIQTENIYKDIAEMHEHFDFSDYKPKHPIYKALGKEKISLNKKVPGKFKDESCGTAMWKFCGPRPKLYSYILADGKTDRRAKGVQKVVVKKNLTHDMYED
ncbi:31244_t:CDS:2, partial [Gigaspora margarita]